MEKRDHKIAQWIRFVCDAMLHRLVSDKQYKPLKKKALRCFETSQTTYPSTQCHRLNTAVRN
jgi:hypothetical protein